MHYSLREPTPLLLRLWLWLDGTDQTLTTTTDLMMVIEKSSSFDPDYGLVLTLGMLKETNPKLWEELHFHIYFWKVLGRNLLIRVSTLL
jgi:hypothetical protein